MQVTGMSTVEVRRTNFHHFEKSYGENILYEEIGPVVSLNQLESAIFDEIDFMNVHL
jgi:hypothetical protein